MCGFSVAVTKDNKAKLEVVKSMCDAIYHRGPDSENSVTYFSEKYVNMAHVRLEIVDHNELSNQPYEFNNLYSLVFNGEIYNFKEIRDNLKSKGYKFITDSDTEVLLKSYAEWGVEMLNMLNGMFAFVIYDKVSESIFLARDRYGVKPIYYAFDESNDLYIASEIKQFGAIPKFNLQENLESSYNFLINAETPKNENTFFSNVFKIKAGCYVLHKLNRDFKKNFNQQRWYDYPRQSVNHLSFQDASKNFKKLFDEALAYRLNCDVDIAITFSGGLDSSSVLFSLEKINIPDDLNIKTFSGRFHNTNVDEGEYINHGVNQSRFPRKDINLSPICSIDEFKKFSRFHDEPLLTSAVFAQWQLFKNISNEGARVVIDGLGADEILAGYKSFYRPRLKELLLKKQLMQLIKEARHMSKNFNFSILRPFVWLLSSILPSHFIKNTRARFNIGSVSKDFLSIESPKNESSDSCNDNFYSFSRAMHKERSLPQQLQWSDRNSMAFSIETRSPFLDFRLVDLLLPLPSEFKISSGENKRLLKSAMKDRIPQYILHRRDKQGFESPESLWLLESMNEIASNMIHDIEHRHMDIFSAKGLNYLKSIQSRETKYNSFYWRSLSYIFWRSEFFGKS